MTNNVGRTLAQLESGCKGEAEQPTLVSFLQKSANHRRPWKFFPQHALTYSLLLSVAKHREQSGPAGK